MNFWTRLLGRAQTPEQYKEDRERLEAERKEQLEERRMPRVIKLPPGEKIVAGRLENGYSLNGKFLTRVMRPGEIPEEYHHFALFGGILFRTNVIIREVADEDKEVAGA